MANREARRPDAVLIAAVGGGGTSTTLTSQIRLHLTSCSVFLEAQIHSQGLHRGKTCVSGGGDAGGPSVPARRRVLSVRGRDSSRCLGATEKLDGSSETSVGRAPVHAMVLQFRVHPAHASALERDLCALGAARECRVTGDAEAPARCVRASRRFPRGETIVLICGTGSAAFAFTEEEETGTESALPQEFTPLCARTRVGGRGHILGDQGSAFWIGREALSRALLAHDEGSHNQGTEWITKEALALFELEHFQDVVDVAQHPERGKTLVASFARIVAKGATLPPAGSSRQSLCADIMEEAGAWMGRLAASVMRSSRSSNEAARSTSSNREYHIVLVGSVWVSWAHIGPAVKRAVLDACDSAHGQHTHVSFLRLGETCAIGALHDAVYLALGSRGNDAASVIARRIASDLHIVDEVCSSGVGET